LWGEVVKRTLTGTYERNLDDKFRLALPKPLRRQFSQEEELSLFVAPGTQRSLSLYSPDEFRSLAEKLAERATNRVETKNYFRLLYSRAEEVAVDAQGRIRIPERLVEHAALKHDLVLLGVSDHAEIWDKGLWQEFLAANAEKFDEMALHAFD
jgi:MraZ protein